MKLRARWTGPLPEVGDVLRSPGPRAKCAYVITGTRIVQKLGSQYVGPTPRCTLNCTVMHRPGCEARCDCTARPCPHTGVRVTRVVFEVERIGLDQLPTGAAVHDWTWDKRDVKMSDREQRAWVLADVKALHTKRRVDGVCIQNATHGKAFRGGRCEACWTKKLAAERRRP